MTQDECQAIVELLMVAVNKQIDAKLAPVVKHENCVVRFVSESTVYVRQMYNLSTPDHATPSSVAELDDGDVPLPNVSGQTLTVGDAVEVLYTASITDGFVARKYGV